MLHRLDGEPGVNKLGAPSLRRRATERHPPRLLVAELGKASMEETIWACPRLHDAIHRGRTVPLRNGKWLDQHGWTEPPLVVDY
jgi:hypothetical protein